MRMLALPSLFLLSLLCLRPAAAEELTRLYAGDDGGALYTRSDGSTFVAFAEHPGKDYAFVLRGTIKDNIIDVDWWDVPKGKRPRKGEAMLQWSQNGARIVRTGGSSFGPDTFSEIKPEQVPWPGVEVAGFQGQGAGDLNGTFNAEDKSRWYIRETAFSVVGVAEAAAQPGERPRWVAVFFGKRTQKGAGSISGEWFDVAKGLDRKKGSFGAVLMTPADAIWGRELTVQLTGTKRGVKIEPDYAIDYDKMAKVIEGYMKQSDAVGWAYAIAGHGTVLRKGAGGSRQLKQDGGQRDFTPNTLAQAASASKLVTAATLAKALKDTGHDFNDKVAQFLPKCWKRGPGVNSLTFGDIAAHNTGFDDDATEKAVPDGNLARRVRKTFEMGQVKTPKRGDYQNYNYAVFRYLIPLVAKRQQALGIFEKFDCKDTALLNEQISVLFNELTFDMLRMANVKPGKDASFLPQGDEDFSLNYDWKDRKAKGNKPNEEGPYRGGAGYLALSAVGAGKFLAAFDAGEIVPMSCVRTMKHEKYGFDGGFGSKAGRAVWKNGGCPGGTCKSWAIVFPGHVQAYLVTNSGYFVQNGTRDPKAGFNLGEFLVMAYDEGFK